MEPNLSSRDNTMLNLTDIAHEFTFVLDKGLVASESMYHPQLFGNALLVMKGASFSLKFIRDREQIFVKAGSDIAGWHQLEYVLEFLNNSIPRQKIDGRPVLAIMAHTLQLNWNKVIDLLNDRQKISQLRTFIEQRSAQESAAFSDRLHGAPYFFSMPTEISPEKELHSRALRLRPQAADAFRRKDYAKAAELYGSIRASLSPAEIKKLAFAEKRLKR